MLRILQKRLLQRRILKRRVLLPAIALVGLLWITSYVLRLTWELFWFIITIIAIIWFPIRYIRLVGNAVAHWRYKSIPISPNPTRSSKDVTVIVPIINIDVKELEQTIRSMLACDPFQIFVVTRECEYSILQEFSRAINTNNLKVLMVPVADKRLQLCQAIPEVKTDIVVFADGDVTWPSTILPWLLAPFEDPEMGGVGTSQRVRRLRTGPLIKRIINWLGAAYIERRNFEISATHWIDGGTSCMSGRTHAVRTETVKDCAFLSGFREERWGENRLQADDDNFVTRWLVAKRWKTWVQYNPKCEIETTLENDFKFFDQCDRWARSNWRSNYTSLLTGLWRHHPWCTYALYLTMYINFALADLLLIPLSRYVASSFETRGKILTRVGFFTWWLFTKNVKLVGLYQRDIWDIRFLPVSILFGWCHIVIKLKAACNLHKTGWDNLQDFVG